MCFDINCLVSALYLQDEDEETRLQREQEAEIQKNKARQVFLENMYVLIAMVLIVVLAVVTVVLKALLFTDEEIVTFIPLQQQVFNLTPGMSLVRLEPYSKFVLSKRRNLLQVYPALVGDKLYTKFIFGRSRTLL